jgi:hypothetical protein
LDVVNVVLLETQYDVVFGLLFSLCLMGGGGSFGLTGSVAEVPVYCGGWRMLLWVGVHRPAAAAASQSFYDFYKQLTELSANKLALVFCWRVGT